MMELPEVLTFAKQIKETLTGKEVARAEAGHTPHGFARYTGDPASYEGILRGKRVTDADAYSGALRMHLEDETLLLGAPPRYHAPGKKLPPKHQLLLEFTDGSAMTCSVQMWGSFYLYKRGDDAKGLPDDYVVTLAPTPLEGGFTRAYFLDLLEGCPAKYSVKQFLATEQRFPGLGNGCLQDILWTARLNPRHKLAELSEGQKDTLYRATTDIVRAMTEGGGRDTEKDLFSRNGGYRTVCSSKHIDEPCPSCGGFIKREAYLGGNVYFCPVCQI
jgi:formamidopyrimidine-DNA glycosylase